MAEIRKEAVQAAEYLHSRNDLYVVGPFSTVELRTRDEKDQWNIMVAPSRPLGIRALNSFEQELASHLNPTEFLETNLDTSLNLVRLGELSYKENVVVERPRFSLNPSTYTTTKLRGEIVVFPNQKLLDLAAFGMAAASLLRLVGSYYDTSYFGVFVGVNVHGERITPSEEDLRHRAKILQIDLMNSGRVTHTIIRGLFDGTIKPEEIKAMIKDFVIANASHGIGKEPYVMDVARFVNSR